MITQDITKRGPGRYVVEFVERRRRFGGHGVGHTPETAGRHADAMIAAGYCVVRDVDTGEEFHDASHCMMDKLGRYEAIVDGERYAKFRPVES